MRGHLCVRKQTRTEKEDMSLHEAHSTGGDHTLQHVNGKTQGKRGGVLETRTNRKGLHTVGNSKHLTVQVVQIGQSVLQRSSVSNTTHHINGGCQ